MARAPVQRRLRLCRAWRGDLSSNTCRNERYISEGKGRNILLVLCKATGIFVLRCADLLARER